MIDWLKNQFLAKIVNSETVKKALAGLLLAALVKVCAAASAALGVPVTVDAATVNQFVNWILGLFGASIISGGLKNFGTGTDTNLPPASSADKLPGE
jgi:hypothetical protein